MLKIIIFIRKNLVWNISIAMLLGLLVGYFFETEHLKSLILPVTILMIYPMMVTLDIRSVFSNCDYR